MFLHHTCTHWSSWTTKDYLKEFHDSREVITFCSPGHAIDLVKLMASSDFDSLFVLCTLYSGSYLIQTLQYIWSASNIHYSIFIEWNTCMHFASKQAQGLSLPWYYKMFWIKHSIAKIFILLYRGSRLPPPIAPLDYNILNDIRPQ